MRQACGGRATAAQNFHLTLAFLGAIEAHRLDALHALAASLALPGFRLVLDRTGWWPRQRLAWAAASEAPVALMKLAAGLATALRASGFAVERRTFKPHVTLLRDVRMAPAPSMLDGAAWTAEEFVLASSEPGPRGPRYRIIGRWPLAGGL